MRMVDLIEKKKNGETLKKEEIQFMISGYVDGSVPDYQMSAMLMAIWQRGMTDEETAYLTIAMEHSGDVVDLSPIPGCKVDKHSTGGVGDKTTLIVAPVAAACGVRVAKMSGRSLGHTGGTLDKLESIPGYRTSLSKDEFFRIVREVGVSLIGQTGNLVPADKKIYALRDVTATVDSLPLIASSIMSKKLAAGSDAIVLDVKTGSGAFMKTEEDAIRLAQLMVKIGKHAGRRVLALITEMDTPLGNAIGGALEVAEAIEVLNGGGPKDLRLVAEALATEMVILSGTASGQDALYMVRKALDDKLALDRFMLLVEAQGGDTSVIRDPSRLPQAACSHEIRAPRGGYLLRMDTGLIGTVSMMLGTGREKLGEDVCHGAGLRLMKKKGDRVHTGEVIAILYADDPSRFAECEEKYLDALTFSDIPPMDRPMMLARVSEQGVARGSLQTEKNMLK